MCSKKKKKKLVIIMIMKNEKIKQETKATVKVKMVKKLCA